MPEISEALYARMDVLIEQGKRRFAQGRYDEAGDVWLEAYSLLPEPKTEWSYATWLLTAVGDARFQTSRFEESREMLFDAMNCMDGLGNPFILFRLGQAEYEMELWDIAREHLLQAYMLDGKDVFAEDDPKYLEHLKELI